MVMDVPLCQLRVVINADVDPRRLWVWKCRAIEECQVRCICLRCGFIVEGCP